VPDGLDYLGDVLPVSAHQRHQPEDEDDERRRDDDGNGC
jgi:hypothetical protein